MAKEAVAPKCLTKWSVFEDIGFYPTEIWCQWYQGSPNLADTSCHSRMRPDAAQLMRHATGLDHGGNFIITFKRVNKAWPGWKEFAAAGFEIQSLACDACHAVLPINANHILNHYRTHPDCNRRRRDNQTFRFTIGNGVRLPEELDDEPADVE